MTKIEHQKCEKMMERAFLKAHQSESDFAESERHLKDGNELEWETFQRKSDQEYGEACGIYDTLQALGYKHTRMKELADLI